MQKGVWGFRALFKRHRFRSADFWQNRYAHGGTSGAGSYGRLAEFKASILNRLVRDESIRTVIELGCGDGSQLALADYPQYLGIDVASAAVEACRDRFASDPRRTFMTLEEFRRARPGAELLLSLDVIFHLVEDDAFDAHMRDLFGASARLVAIYSSNSDAIADPAPHVRHRTFTDWVARHATGWRLIATHKNPHPYRWYDRKNTSPCDFYIFEKRAG